MNIHVFTEAEALFSKNRFKEAEIKYSEFIEASLPKINGDATNNDEILSEKLAMALNNRGQIKYQQVDFDEAIDDYTVALQHKPDFAVAFYNRGQIHYRLARFQQGISDFRRALSIQPDFPDCSLALQTAQADMREAEEKSSSLPS